MKTEKQRMPVLQMLTLWGGYHRLAYEYRLPNSSFCQAFGWIRSAWLADLMILKMLVEF